MPTCGLNWRRQARGLSRVPNELRMVLAYSPADPPIPSASSVAFRCWVSCLRHIRPLALAQPATGRGRRQRGLACSQAMRAGNALRKPSGPTETGRLAATAAAFKLSIAVP